MCINWINAQKVDVRVELTKKTSHCKSRDFLRKRRLKKLIINNKAYKKGTERSETMLVCNKNDGPQFKGAIL